MQREAIVLVGGFGTRLKSIVSSVPKPLAPIAGKPFLFYLFQELVRQKISRVILATGYESTQIVQFCTSTTWPFAIDFSHEQTPLGTGGALQKALLQAHSDRIFVLNGDTFFPIDFSKLEVHDNNSDCEITLALKTVSNSSRYGKVQIQDGKVLRFSEKGSDPSPGLINGGIFLLRKDGFLENVRKWNLRDAFSLEKDIYPRLLQQFKMGAVEFSDPFIDIGIPEDFAAAQSLIPSFQPI